MASDIMIDFNSNAEDENSWFNLLLTWNDFLNFLTSLKPKKKKKKFELYFDKPNKKLVFSTGNLRKWGEWIFFCKNYSR